MADDRDDQQRNSFHWPPTSEELESIQVIEVHDDAPASAGAAPVRATSASPWRAWWHRMMQEAVIAQVGLAAASLAAIGIAVTSLLAPAEPTARTKNTARATATAPVASSTTSSASTSTSTAPSVPNQVVAADPTPFQHMVTFAPPPPALEQVRAEREARATAARLGEHSELTPSEELAAAREERAAARAQRANSSRGTATAASLQTEAGLQPQKPRATVRAPRQTVVARHATPPAGSDPVSRLATRTGLSVWKAMRAVGRSLKPDNVVATR